MKKIIGIVIGILVIAIVYFIVSSNNTQTANPASTYCLEQDGTLDIQTLSDGSEYGVCKFEDDSECEEWKLYRGECKKGQYIIDSDLICTMEYAPVCAVNGVTYSNRCFAGDIPIDKEGEC